MYEIVKYITKIEFVKSDGVVELLFDDLNMLDRIKIVESLSVKMNKNILSFIEKVKEFEDKFTDLGDDKVIKLETSFFSDNWPNN